MKHILYSCYVICHSVIDDITAVKPLVTRRKGPLELSFGGSVCGDSTAGVFPSPKVGLMHSFMFAWTSRLTNSRVASELTSHDTYQ